MLAREVEQIGNIPVSFDLHGVEKRVDPQVEMSLYRMVQESLNNVIRHADADQAWVELTFTDSDLTVRIRDNGKGFQVPINPSEFPEKGHFGLLGLQERSDIIQAELSIQSKPGSGTTITIHLCELYPI
jgi:signal transduction histidine kinase